MVDATMTLPKVELHLHLEGAIPLEALWVLIQKHGGDPDVPDLAALERRFVYRDFGHFLRTWLWKSRFHSELDDFTFICIFQNLVFISRQEGNWNVLKQIFEPVVMLD